LRPFVRRSVYALLDEPVLRALDLPKQPAWLTQVIEGGLKVRAAALRWMPRRRQPRLLSEMRHRSYPYSYRLEELGPENVPPPEAAQRAAVREQV
jgi:hypothetical protein